MSDQNEKTVPLMRGDTVADNTDYRDALPVNLTVVAKEVREAPGYLLSHPGLSSFATGLGADRAGYWNGRQSTHFRVSGQNLIRVDDDGSTVTLGSIPGTDQASMTHSFTTQSIVAAGKWYLFDGTNLVHQTDSNLGTPIDHTWIDGYYFFTDGESLYHTLSTDETQIDPLDYATSEYSPDPTLAVDKTSDNQVIVFNRYTTEWFINRALDNFAFQRVPGKATKCGIVGTHAETELEGRFYVIGGGREESVSIHAIAGGQYEGIATREVDKILATYTEDELKLSVLETRVQADDKFILVRLLNHTLLWNKDIANKFGNEQAWTIVKTEIETDGPWRGVNGVSVPNIGWVYGDLNTDDIGRLDYSIATQYGEQVETILYTPFVTLEKMSVSEMEVDILPGHQVNAENVTTFISATYDGVVYSQERTRVYGSQYDYLNRLIFYRLGYVDNFVGWKLRTVSPERLAFSRCYIEYG